MNLTDNEIIKALECCVRATSGNDCEKLHCPACKDFGCYFMDISTEDYPDSLIQEICKSALDLINRLKAENDELKNRSLMWAQKYDNRRKANRLQTTEILGLQTKVKEQQAEIERLQEENKSIRYCYEQAKSYNNTLAESCEKNCKKFNMTTRAETIKDFAERLKEKRAGWGYPMFVLEIDAIDNLVKEMEKGNG